MPSKKYKGQRGEQLARSYLERKGYEILAQNWRYSRAEIDIIAKLPKINIIVFVEVKTRSTYKYGYPEEAVNNRKARLLAMAAEAYLAERNLECEVRFDIISILLQDRHHQIVHIEDAFFFYDK